MAFGLMNSEKHGTEKKTKHSKSLAIEQIAKWNCNIGLRKTQTKMVAAELRFIIQQLGEERFF